MTSTFSWFEHTSFGIFDIDGAEVASANLAGEGIFASTPTAMSKSEAKAFANGLIVLSQGGIFDDGGPLPADHEVGA